MAVHVGGAGMFTRIERLFRALAVLGALCFAAAALVTVADVVLRKVGTGIIGTVDYVQLFIVAGAFLAMPYAFAEKAHVSVDIVLEILPGRARQVLLAGTGLLVFTFCCLLAWSNVGAFLRTWHSSDISMNVGIAMWLYWLPFAAGISISALAAGINCWKSIRGLDRSPRSTH
jgi:TRAP-type C4-dicarboxylate transport system permease small subunit